MRGFERYPQQPSPNPQQVGAALASQGQQPEQQPMRPVLEPGQGPLYPGDDMAAGRLAGARFMSGREQSLTADDNPAAVNAAIGEALTRLGNGYKTNDNPFKDREKAARLMQQHGLSETEARLMIESGGF